MGVPEKLSEWFRRQIGVREQGENNVIYNTHFYGTAVSGSQFPWCCAFIWDGFRETGLSQLFCGGEKTAYCPYVMGWAKAHGQWVEGDYAPGDLLLYDWDGDGTADHIGFCTAWDGWNAAAIEGNSKNAVELRVRAAGEILGAFRPAYPVDAGAPEETPVQPREEREGDYHTVQAGDSLWSIAEERLGDGLRWREIYETNSLNSTLLHPGDVLQLPRAGEWVNLTVRLRSQTAETLRLRAGARGMSVEQLIEEMTGGRA